jgi:hypothetical protein
MLHTSLSAKKSLLNRNPLKAPGGSKKKGALFHWSGTMRRLFLILLGLGLMAAPAGLAASPRSADWMIPRPVTTPSSDRPARIIDVASVRYKWYELHRASLLNDGRLLLWESGRSMDDPGDWSACQIGHC